MIGDKEFQKDSLLDSIEQGGIMGYVTWKNKFDETTILLSELASEGLVEKNGGHGFAAALTPLGKQVVNQGGYSKWKKGESY